MSADFDRVALSDVSRHYGRRRAVSRVTLEVSRGEILALLGPNGAGKSTLIGMLATLVAPTSGTIRYGRHDAAAAGSEIRRRIGLLAHELHLYAELSARENLEFFARLYGLRPADVVEPALDRAGLSDRADDQVGAFSRGMRQRLALERALLHRPRLVLLDEPFTGLDDQAVGRVSDRLRALASNTIILLATHDIDLVQGLATRMAVIRDGRLVGDEPASSDLRSRYRSLLSQHSSRMESRSAAAPARAGEVATTREAESLRSRLSDSEAAPAHGGEVATTREAESLRSRPNGSEAAPARGGEVATTREAESLRSRPNDSDAAPARGGEVATTREAESLRSRPNDSDAAPARGGEVATTREAESLRSRPNGSEAAPARGGGAPRE